MYVPKHFEETRVEVLHELMRAHPLSALVTGSAAGFDANHLPLVVHAEPEPYGTLRGHISRANPFWRELTAELPALAIFQGPESFITPSWYPTKRETGKVVPTWNSVVVHAHGVLRAMDDRVWLRAHLEELTHQHEGPRALPWMLTDAPADYIEQMMNAIVGFELRIERLVGKWKVSQNRSAADRTGVIDGLSQEGGEAAAVMAKLVDRTNHDA